MSFGLRKSLVEIPVAAGIDRKTNAKLVLPGSLLVLENGRFFEGGTIRKRNGYAKLGVGVVGGDDIASGQALGRYRDELLLFDAGSLYSYSTALAKWVDRGGVPPLSARREIVYGNQTTITNPDIASASGLTIYAWTDSRGGVRATVMDEETGAAFVSDVEISATAVRPRCVAIGTHLFVIYVEGTDLKAKRIDITSPSAFEGPYTLRVDVDPTAGEQHVDAKAFSPAGSLEPSAVFVYTSTADITVGYLLEDGVVGDPTRDRPSPQAIGDTAEQSLAIQTDEDADSILVFWSNAVALSGAAVVPGTLAVGAASVIDASNDVVNVTATDGGRHVFYEITAAEDTNHQVWYAEVDAAAALVTSSILRRSVGLASKALLHGADPYVCTVFAGTLQSTFFVLDITGRIVGRLLSQNAGGLQTGALPSMLEQDSDTFAWAAPVKTRFVSEDNVTYSRVGLAKSTIAFGGDGQYRGVQAVESFVLPGGMVSVYDGFDAVESGFHVFPELLAAVTQNNAGGTMAGDGTYSFTWIYEWYDAKGQVHRSAPGVPIVVVVPAGTDTNRCSFEVPTLRLTEKTDPRPEVRIICYSTKKDGLVFYRTPHQAGTATDGVENDPTADTVTFERTVADASIETNEFLYSQGTSGADSGELANLCPPAARLVATGKGRVLLAGLENPRGWMYSKRLLPGRAPEFSDFLQGEIPEDVTAIALLDDKLIFFARDAIYVVAGDGPDNLGQNDTFSAPQLLTSDVGCVESRSIANIPSGITFQSAKGIYHLSRGLAVEYIGAPVEAFNGQTIVSSTLVDDANEVRFLTDDGYTLVYDYFFRQWATWTNHEGNDAALFDGDYCYLRSDGKVYREDAETFTDDGVAIHLKLRTGWLKPGSLQGLKRIWRIGLLGDFHSEHDLRGRIYRDYREFAEGGFTWEPGEIFDPETFGALSFGDGPFGGSQTADRVYQMRHHLKRQKCEAISIEIEDRGSVPGQAYSISALALEVGILPGIHRLPAGKTV